MRNLKKFNSQESYNAYILTDDAVSPAIMLNDNNKSLHYYKKQDIPLKYKPLQYISSTKTGGQYIDLGCHLLENTDDIKIDIKFNFKGRGKNASGGDPNLSTLISSQPEISPWPGFVLRILSQYYNRINLQAKWQFTNSVKRGIENKYDSKYLTHWVSDSTYNTFEYPGIYEFTEILDNIPQSQVNNCTCTLFCALDSSNNPFRFVEADLYYLRFTKGDNTVRDLVPCINKQGIAGLYDKVTKHFYKSQGTEEFVAGSSI